MVNHDHLVALDDLMTVAPVDHRPALERQLDLLTDVSGSAAQTRTDREAALIADLVGLGSADELVTGRD